MLKISAGEIEALDARYPGLAKTIAAFEDKELPGCPRCLSNDTASVQVGIIGRTINLAAATTKVRLVPNDPPDRLFCNACKAYFHE